jgi:hypothetical protein
MKHYICAYCHTVMHERWVHLHICPETNEQRRREGEPEVMDECQDPIRVRGQKPTSIVRDVRLEGQQ